MQIIYSYRNETRVCTGKGQRLLGTVDVSMFIISTMVMVL